MDAIICETRGKGNEVHTGLDLHGLWVLFRFLMATQQQFIQCVISNICNRSIESSSSRSNNQEGNKVVK